MNEKDRIRLAETMGICPNDHEDVCLDSTWNEFDKCVDCGVRVEDGHTFDPEHDANDDYAVLEWMRNKKEDLSDPAWGGSFGKFAKLLKSSCWYEIGDYARAALKVLAEAEIDE